MESTGGGSVNSGGHGFFLGFDFSTQQVKAVAVNASLQILFEAAVCFDLDLPEYRTNGGVRKCGDRVTAPVIMWVKAFDMIMDKLRVAGLDFQNVVAVSGAGQQHGSVYWKQGSEAILMNLDPGRFAFEQLKDCFSVQDSPVWMDSSTSEYCELLENRVGGAQVLADLTGSRAYERFTGNQIAKIFSENPAAYSETERISLVSSFACSLFLGSYAAIDWSDGSGMNLLDIVTRDWNDSCLNACAPGLKEKLGGPIRPSTCLGNISGYLIERCGFNPGCKVVAFTGDNPSSLAGMCLQRGDLAISLGTSDTLFLTLDRPTPSLEGHVFYNPVDDNYMALLCFKNGSLTRQRIMKEAAQGSWDLFETLLSCSPVGNDGFTAMYFDDEEITPKARGIHRFDGQDRPLDRFEQPATEVRALVEGQFLAKRVHAEKLGFRTGSSCRILATGGASANKAMLQVLADVFGADVFTQDTANSCCLGAAYRAAHGSIADSRLTFSDYMSDRRLCLKIICRPRSHYAQIYSDMAVRYERLEQSVAE